MNKRLEDLRKMRLHTNDGLQIVEYDGSVSMLVKHYKETAQDTNNTK